MKYAVHLVRRPERASDDYGPFESIVDAYDWAEDVKFCGRNRTLPGFFGVEYEVFNGEGLTLRPPFDTLDTDAPGDWS